MTSNHPPNGSCHQSMIESTIGDTNSRQKQVGEISTFYREAPFLATSTPRSYRNQGRRCKAHVTVFATCEWSSKGEIDDATDGDQVDSCKNHFARKKMIGPPWWHKQKAVIVQLNAAGRILRAIPFISTQIQPQAPYNSAVFPLFNKEFSWNISWRCSTWNS